MSLKQDTIQDLIDGENMLLAEAKEKYGEYHTHALDFGSLLSSFLISIDSDRFIFAAFLSQVRKDYFLALFSALRLHHVQAGMNIRQMLESGAWAAYAIGNPEKEKFTEEIYGILKTPDRLETARNNWLSQNYTTGSDSIKNQKGIINKSVAHASIIYAFKTFRFDAKAGKFETPFFDFEDRFHVKTDLWFIANVALGLVDLFYGINKERNVIKFSPTFVKDLKSLEIVNIRLKKELSKGRSSADPRP
ncbi:MAG: hypothetical protein WC495_06005 [Patescibacteria group bacterium]|jgi:hypothetical protein